MNLTDKEEAFKRNLETNMTELYENLASLWDARDRGFAESLCSFYEKKGFLTGKQLYWACKFWTEVQSGEKQGIEKLPNRHTARDRGTAPIDEKLQPPRVAVDGRLLISYFDKAADKLQVPKIRYKILPKPLYGTEQLVFYRTGQASHSPNCVGVTNGLVYPNNRILAIMYRDGRTVFYPYTFDKPEIQQLVRQIALDPLAAFSENGKLTVSCCYCLKELSHPSSRYYGYGPICAENWGLPWGDVPPPHTQLSIGYPVEEGEEAGDSKEQHS